jgi:hypothetical protein
VRSGLEILDDVPGTGAPVERQRSYRLRLRIWLSRGDAVRWTAPWGVAGRSFLEDEGATLVTETRINRSSLMNGLFYGVEGMRIGGTRRLRISPHLAYGERGVAGIIPPNAVLVAEITVLGVGGNAGG